MTIRYITVVQYRNERKRFTGLAYYNGIRIINVFPFRKHDGNTVRVALYNGTSITTQRLDADELIELR